MNPSASQHSEHSPAEVASNFAEALRSSPEFKRRFDVLAVELVRRLDGQRRHADLGALAPDNEEAFAAWNEAMAGLLPTWSGILPAAARTAWEAAYAAYQLELSAAPRETDQLPAGAADVVQHDPSSCLDKASSVSNLRELLDDRRRREFERLPWCEEQVRASFYLDRARLHLFCQQYPDAVLELKQAIEVQPTSGEAWFLLGAAHEECGDTEAALDCLKTAVRFDPTLPGVGVRIANLREKLGLPRYPGISDRVTAMPEQQLWWPYVVLILAVVLAVVYAVLHQPR